MTHGSLFAGIGGFDLGFAWAGIETLWQVEIEDYARRVLEKRTPKVKRVADIWDDETFSLAPVDIISGGFPCQPFSQAGLKKGTSDDRYLWPQMLRVIQWLRPAWVVCENVPGFDGLGLDRTIDDLETSGYEVAPTLEISAVSVGTYHLRRRIWIIAYSQSNGRGGSIRGNTKDIEKPSWPRLRKPPGALDSRLLVFDEFEKGVGKPAVLGMDDGLPHRVDRLRGLGNAIVPQIAEIIGRMILEADGSLS